MTHLIEIVFSILLTGLFSVVVAWLTHHWAVRQLLTRAEKRPRVLLVEDPTTSIEYWKPKRIIWIQSAIAVVYLAIILVTTGESLPLISAAIGLLLGVLMTVILTRRKPPSRVFKAASFVIAEEPPEALRQCLDVLSNIGARIARVDEEAGRIQAKVPMSFWGTGYIININVERQKEARSEIRISSDSIVPWILFDFGTNARVLQRIKSGLLGL